MKPFFVNGFYLNFVKKVKCILNYSIATPFQKMQGRLSGLHLAGHSQAVI